MTDQEYRALQKVSNSGLTNMLKSPLHYQHFCKHEGEDTPDMAFGRLYHCAILEPQELVNRFQGLDPEKRPQRSINPKTLKPWTMATKENAAWFEAKRTEADEAGKTLVMKSDWETVQKMRKVINSHPQAVELLRMDGLCEHVVQWTDESTGIECKGKIDKLIPGKMVIDLKTANDARNSKFLLSSFEYGYHRQGAHYTTGAGVKEFRIIAQEKKAPFAVNVFYATESDFLYWGRMEVAAMLKQVARIRELYGSEWGDKIWPGYGWMHHGASELAYTEWMQKKIFG